MDSILYLEFFSYYNIIPPPWLTISSPTTMDLGNLSSNPTNSHNYKKILEKNYITYKKIYNTSLHTVLRSIMCGVLLPYSLCCIHSLVPWVMAKFAL